MIIKDMAMSSDSWSAVHEAIDLFVPKQRKARKVGVRLHDVSTTRLADMPGNDKFKPHRIVANIELYDKDTDGPVVFDPPLQLRVKYTSADYEFAKGALKLAKWTGKDWEVLLQITSGMAQGGSATFTLSQLGVGDPSVGWGG
jgi:hypothetical protein